MRSLVYALVTYVLALFLLTGSLAAESSTASDDDELLGVCERIVTRAQRALGEIRARLGEAFPERAETEGALLQLEGRMRAILWGELLGEGSPPPPTTPGETALSPVDLRDALGGFGTGPAIAAALDWLARHQSPDGRWSAARFGETCRANRCEGPGAAGHDVGVTALALLAFLGGPSMPEGGPHADVASRGLDWLLKQQDGETGLIGERADERFLFGHALAVRALAGAARARPSSKYRTPLRRALRCIRDARNPFAAWRYALPPNGENDAIVTGEMLLALQAGAQVGFPIGACVEDGGFSWLERLTDPESGRTGYVDRGGSPYRFPQVERTHPASRSEAPTALALLCSLERDPAGLDGALGSLQLDLLRRSLPDWSAEGRRNSVDPYYWLHATRALRRAGGEEWDAWILALKEALLPNQRSEGDERGSWDPVDPWGAQGGRVYMTAICALCLEIETDAPVRRQGARHGSSPVIAGRVRRRIDAWVEDSKSRLRGREAPPLEFDAAWESFRNAVHDAVTQEIEKVPPRLLAARAEPAAGRRPARPARTSRTSGASKPPPHARATGRSREALDAALDWLARHQAPDGRWDCDGFSAQCATNRCDGPGEALYDVGVTGLAVLALLGDGNTLLEGKHRDALVRGLRWIASQQRSPSGLVGEQEGSSYLYCHAIGTIAMSRAADPALPCELRDPAQRAVNFILTARNPYKAWRYYTPPDGDNDSSVTGWMTLALRAAQEAGLVVDPAAYDGALAWFDEVTDPTTGRTGYQERGASSSRLDGTHPRFPVDRTEALTAVSLFDRLLLGQEPHRHAILRSQTDRLRRMPPVWDVTPERSLVDEYYWFFGTQAMVRIGGGDWGIWKQALEKALLENQRRDGDERGSWDPVGAWGRAGGRIYMTAMCAMCLEAPRPFEGMGR